MAEQINDPRFSHLSWDPKFNRVPKRERKVKIDDRFKSMFTESKFQSKVKIDKRGRPLKRTANEDLKRYYDLASSDEESNDEEKFEAKKKTDIIDETKKETGKNDKIVVENVKSIGDEAFTDDKTSGSDDDSDLDEFNFDLARGEGNLESSSSDNDSDAEWEFEENKEIPEHNWGELDADAETTDVATRRFAVCNMDWDRIKAKDLLVLFNSFKPQMGMIKSCTIYPSEYGLQRMKDEEIEGPKELLKKRSSDVDDGDESENNSDYEKNDQDDDAYVVHREKIRKYQMNRLKYFYAVVECDSVETSNAIYGACDGVEYESSAAKLDLRFIPDDMTFDHDQVKDEAKDLGDLSSYKPTLFRNAALQQSKVELTWEESDVHRRELMKRAFDDDYALDSNQFRDIIAPCSSDDEAADDDEFIGDKNSIELDSNEPEREEKIKKKKGKKPKRKIKKTDDDDFSVNVQDPRFAALYTSHLYNIDPSDPAYKKSKQMDSLVQEKITRIPKISDDRLAVDKNVSKKKDNSSVEKVTETAKLNKESAADLSLLIKSVKSKTDVWQKTKKFKRNNKK